MLWTHAAAATIALAVGFAGGWQVQAWRHGRLAAEQTAQLASAREGAMHGALIETTRRLQAQQEAAHAAAIQARQARDTAAAADAVAGRLREHAASLAARASACNSAAAPIGPPASAPGDLLADMLRRLEASGRELAAEADRRGVAGGECAERYRALTPP